MGTIQKITRHLDPRQAHGQIVELPKRSIYLDANATTPLLPEVFEAMTPWLLERCGNASSMHDHGRRARTAIETARVQVAALLRCEPLEVIFTSGGTESNNLALLGAALGSSGHIITSAIEHHAVLHTVQQLEQQGCPVTYLPVDGGGRVNPENLRRALRPETRLVSIMMANNETGVLQPIKEIGQITREHGALFHTDAVQAAGKVRVDVELLGCDLLSISGHKMHGPQGTGVLFVRRGTKLKPLFYGGSHELGYRPGTENIAGIVGLGTAAALATETLANGGLKRVAELRNALEYSLLREVQDGGVNGSRSARVPNTTNLWFGGLKGRSLLAKLDELGLSVSGGSACSAGTCEPSHVLLALGLSPSKANASIRFSLSKLTSAEDIDFAIWQVSEALEQLRGRSRS